MSFLLQYFFYMSSVEGSDREESLSEQQLQIFIKNNKIQKQRPNFRGSRNVNSQDSIYRQALKQYMFGRFDMASQSCKKMISSNPQNPQPYFLMGTMHQQAANRNNDEAQLLKSVQYFFFHAYYSQPSQQKWLKVAEMSKDLRLYQQAAYCYGRALKIKTNLNTFMERAKCLQQCLQIKKAANIYKRIIQKFSNSPQVYKRYARLRFQREEYSKAREILLSYEGHEKDWAIKFMIAQTYQKQKKYAQLYNFICQKMIKNSQQPINNIYEDLQFEILEMLLICRINCPEKTSQDIDLEQILGYFVKKYDVEYATLYDQIIQHIKNYNPDATIQLLKQMLKHECHQKIQYFLYCSEHLQKIGNPQLAIKFLQMGLNTKKCRNSAQLKTQLNYLKSLLKNKNKGKNQLLTNKSVVKQKYPNVSSQRQGKKQEEQFYFSDQEERPKKQEEDSLNFMHRKEEQVSIFEDKESDSQPKNGKKTKKIQKRSQPTVHHIQAKDPQIIQKLIKTNNLTLQSLKSQLEHQKQSHPNPNLPFLQQSLQHTLNQVRQCLGYLVQVQSNRQQKQQIHRIQSKASQSIYNNREPKKRRMLGTGQRKRYNLISKNSQSLVESLELVIYFMKEYVKMGKYLEVIEFAQILSKAHFFKWQNKIKQFKQLKKQVYEIGVLACLQLKKYGKSIFFLRYLINKNPVNEFYLALAQKIMRMSKGKLFINKMIKKDIDTDLLPINGQNNEKDLVNIFYMTGLEYMQNCFFQLAINMFTNVIRLLQSSIQQEQTQRQKEMCKLTYMCMSTCFLQISSSRTVFNKLAHVNRSAYCFARYKTYEPEDSLQMLYNQARWYTYVHLYGLAIPLYQKILATKTQNQGQKEKQNQQLIQRSAINLMLIYRDQNQFDKIKEISQKYLCRQ